ncbi:MAG: hemerythrin domain-containing protein, partial [Bdellovibrionota bacterium]
SGKSPVRKASDESDITDLMLRDHKPLKRLLKTMKDTDASIFDVRVAFEQFAPLLEAHSRPEEDSLYEWMTSDEEELRVAGFEGKTEHAIADQLAKEIQNSGEGDEFRARIKVLAELVEHHVKEEEEDLIPRIRKLVDLEERVRIGRHYTDLRDSYRVDEKAA